MLPGGYWILALLFLWAQTGAGLTLPFNGTSDPFPVLPVLPRVKQFTCWNSSQKEVHTSVEGCRSTLNYLRTIHTYRVRQAFQKDKSPKIAIQTHEGRDILCPPFRFHSVKSDCALQVDTVIEDAIDVFSFQEVRARALEILEECQDEGGYGGIGVLGQKKGWEVQVVGYLPPPPPPPPTDRTVLLEGNHGQNYTAVSVVGRPYDSFLQ